MEEYRVCKNCTYYRAHYAKNDNGILYELDSGHCTNKEVPLNQFKRSFKLKSACIRWRQNERLKSEINIGETLKAISDHLQLIAEQLNIDLD